MFHELTVDHIGEPRLWDPPAEYQHRYVKRDTGDYFRDPNAARCLRYPMEAAGRAILSQNPHFNGKGINIVSCSSTLASLSHFVRGVDRSFKFIMGNVDGTIFLIRRENSPEQRISDVRGYGHNFLKEFTLWDRGVTGSESRQRIIRYEFGCLSLLVRLESDGYIPSSTSPHGVTASENEELNVDTNIDTPFGILKKHVVTDQGTSIRVEKNGRKISHKGIVDIKSRARYMHDNPSIVKEFNLTDITPRLWVSQIMTLVVGYHKGGRFQETEILSMKDKVLEWERDNESSLRKLVSLLRQLMECALAFKTNVEVCRQGSAPLEIRTLVNCDMEPFSPHLKESWEKSNNVHRRESHDESRID
jgi:hypothetical protein